MKIGVEFSRLKRWLVLVFGLIGALMLGFFISNLWPEGAGKRNASGHLSPSEEAYIGFYRTYHSASNEEDVREYIEKLFSLWVYSESDFSNYCSAFPTMSEPMAAEFERQINSSDVLGFDRFRPIKIDVSEGRVDLLSSGVDREVWIASYSSSEAVPGYGINSYDTLCGRFVERLKRMTNASQSAKED